MGRFVALHRVPRARHTRSASPSPCTTVPQCQCKCTALRAELEALSAESGAYHALIADIRRPCLAAQTWCRCTAPTPCNGCPSPSVTTCHRKTEACQPIQNEGFGRVAQAGGPCSQELPTFVDAPMSSQQPTSSGPCRGRPTAAARTAGPERRPAAGQAQDLPASRADRRCARFPRRYGRAKAAATLVEPSFAFKWKAL